MLTSIIRQFDPEAPPPSLPPAAALDEEGDPPGKRGIFIRDLLTEVVLPDRNMVVRTADTRGSCQSTICECAIESSIGRVSLARNPLHLVKLR